MEMLQASVAHQFHSFFLIQQPSLGSKNPNPRFQTFLMRGSKDFPQDDWSGEVERKNFVKTVAIILLWIIFFFGAYSTKSWCAGPELEDLFRGYDPLTGKQRRKRLRESKMPSINRFLKNKCLLVWRIFNLQRKRSKNHLWHIFNLGSNWFLNSTSWKIYYL